MAIDPLDPSVSEALRGWRVQHDAGVDAAAALSTTASVCNSDEARQCFLEASRRAGQGQDIDGLLDALKPLLNDGERAVLRAGWVSGRSEQAMDAVLEQRQLWHASRSRIRAGLVLPAGVLLLASFVAPLPALIMSGNLVVYLLCAFTPLGIATAAVLFGRKLLNARAKKDRSTEWLDDYLLRLPLVQTVERNKCIAEAAGVLGLQLSAGVPILEAVRITAAAQVNSRYRSALQSAEAVLRAGRPLGDALKTSALWPPDFINQVVVGERSGALDESLLRAARNARESYTRAIEAFAAWLPKIAYAIVAIFIIIQIIMLAMGYVRLLDGLMDGTQ